MDRLGLYTTLLRAYFVEVEIVVEGEGGAEPGLVAEPGDGVAADGEEDEGHVELEGLGGALGHAHAVAHHLENLSVPVLDVFVSEEGSHDCNPHSHHPNSLPIVQQQVVKISVPPPYQVVLTWLQLLAQHFAQIPAFTLASNGLPWPLKKQHL